MAVCLILVIIACQKEADFSSFKDQKVDIEKLLADKTVIDGRFVFSSKESLSEQIEQFSNLEDERLYEKFENFYEQGFRSHKPLINYENSELIQKVTQNKKIPKDDEYETEEHLVVGDPYLAALLTEKNEIVVNDTLYKFSTGQGLFFSHIRHSQKLFDYFENKVFPLENSFIDVCKMRELYGGVTKVDEEVFRYIRPLDGTGCTNGELSATNFVEDDIISTYSIMGDELQQRINDLPICDGNEGSSLISGLFGDSYVCINKFDIKHRIKIEFWNQKVLFFQSVGVVSKTQRKHFWIWWASKSDELHLGINRIFLKYNYKKPDITSIVHPVLFNNIYKAPLFLYNGNFHVKESPYGFNYVETSIDVVNNSLPFFDFENADILNIYIPNLPIVGNFNFNLTSQKITSESNVKALYKMGLDFLKSKLGPLDENPEFAVTYQKNNDEIEVLYFGERYSKNNENKIKRKLYSDVNFIISSAWNDTNNEWNFNVKPAGSSFRNYTHYELDFYGLARRESTWKGKRMITTK